MNSEIMNDCKRYLESVSLLADGLLEGLERETLEKHLAVCPDCAARHGAYVSFRNVMPGLAEEPPGALASAVLRQLNAGKRQPIHFLRHGLIPLCAAAAVALILLLGDTPLTQNDAPPPMLNTLSGLPNESIQGYGLYDDDLGDSNGWSAGSNPQPADQTEAAAPMALDEAPPSPAPWSSETGSQSVDQPDTAAPTAPDETPLPAPKSTLGRAAADITYSVVVTLTADQAPEILESYPRTDWGDRAEIVVTQEEFDTLWPALQAGGASIDVFPDQGAPFYDDPPAPGGETPGDTATEGISGGAGDETEPPATEQSYALIVVYYVP